MLNDTSPPTIPITPTATASFVNGQWLGNVRILFPLITTMVELRQARMIL